MWAAPVRGVLAALVRNPAWSGVLLGASLTGPLLGSMTCVLEDPVNCVAGFPALSGLSSLSEPRK